MQKCGEVTYARNFRNKAMVIGKTTVSDSRRVKMVMPITTEVSSTDSTGQTEK